jgi:hypothetical protein
MLKRLGDDFVFGANVLGGMTLGDATGLVVITQLQPREASPRCTGVKRSFRSNLTRC